MSAGLVATSPTDELCQAGAVQRNVIVFHGTGANPEVCWLPWLRERLTDRGYAVEVPHYPGLALLQHIDVAVSQAVLVVSEVAVDKLID